MSLKDFLKNIKLREDSFKAIGKSLIVVIIGVFAINILQGNKGKTIPGLQIGDESAYTSASHVVTKGEDLWSISEKYYGDGFSWTKIAEANDLVNPNIISEGQKLIIPSTSSVLGSAPDGSRDSDSANEEAEASNKIHNVEKGDNLWRVAERYYGSGYNWVDIAQTNNISDPEILEIGKELVIPDVQAKMQTVINASNTRTIDGDTYTVEKGDNLWEIAVRAYGDGYKWPEISSKNTLANPGLIVPGQTLALPR